MPKTRVISAKLPAPLVDRVEEAAASRNVTVSALVRAAVEAYLAALEAAPDAGAVEVAVRRDLADRGLDMSSPSAAVCLELARRLDHDPTNASAHVRELRTWWASLAPAPEQTTDLIDLLRARVVLKRAGWQIGPPGAESNGRERG